MVDKSDERTLRRAHRALYGFYEALVLSAADAVLEHESSLSSTYLGHGDEIADRYGPSRHAVIK